MELERYDVLEFNKDLYIILNIINFKNNKYLFLINEDEYKNDTSIVKVVENAGVTEFIHIENDEEFDIVADKLIIDNAALLTNVIEG